MKNILIILLCLIVIGTTVEAKIVKDSLYQIPKTKVAPVIDGLQDNVWKTLDWNMQRIYNVGDPPTETSAADSGVGLTGMSKAMWDANNLYVLFYTVDDILTPIPANRSAAYNQDAIEIYFDGSNDHSTKTSRGATQYQFTIPYLIKDQEVGNLGYAFGTTFDTSGCQFKITDVLDDQGFPGWMCEVKIPLAALGVDGSTAGNTVVGWELQQDESDDASVGRASMSKWWSNSNNSWANPGIWGYALLSNREVDTVVQIVKTSAAITIDGVMDQEYKNANVVTTNLFRVGDPPGVDPADTDPMFGGFMTTYTLWDATNMYVFVDVVDGIITPIPANRSAAYNQDAIELYFDGSNDHSTKTSRGATQYQFTIPYLIKDQEIGNLGYAFGTTFDTSGCSFKIKDHDAIGNNKSITEEGSGWTCEVKIPLAALGIDGSSGNNTPLGYELQLDNSNDAAAGRQGMQKWWSNSNNSWANPGIWGYAQLTDLRIDTRVGSSISNPVSFALDQNYPNPFNPSTEISFSLTKSEKVKLAVYNLLGKEVAVLVNGTRSAGHQTVKFDAANLASGVYFYKLEAGSTVLAKKMMLLK